MCAAALGFAGSYIATTKNPIQFDIDPLVAESDREWTNLFKATVQKLDAAVGAYLKRKGIAPSNVKNTVGDTDPVGPRSTARFVAPALGLLKPDPHPRWLPPLDSPLWSVRKRKVDGTYVPWGMIGGEKAGIDSSGAGTGATNEADQVTRSMHNGGMVFNGDVTSNDIAAYAHGMIQAIYKAYGLGPNCEPDEIAVGNVTKKMASCLPCTLFMSATG